MAKAFFLIRVSGGRPDIPEAISAAGPVNYVLCDIRGDSPPVGAYLVSATGAQLTALDGLAYAMGIVAVTESGVRWPELGEEATQGTIDALNTWLSANGFAYEVPEGISYRVLVRALYRFFNDRFDLDRFNVRAV